jgi:hypothetical protein
MADADLSLIALDQFALDQRMSVIGRPPTDYYQPG